MEMVCEDLNGPRWVSLDHRTVEIRRHEVSAIGYMYPSAQGRILAEAKTGAKGCPIVTPAPKAPAIVPAAPVEVIGTALEVRIEYVTVYVDREVPVAVPCDCECDDAAEAAPVDAVAAPEAPAEVVPTELPRDNPASPWYSTPGSGIGRG